MEQDSKLQTDTPRTPPPDTIISEDTRREERIPPRQSRTLKWPVLDASGSPAIDQAAWTLQIGGLVKMPIELDWDAFQRLDRVRVWADMHCVTRWSRLDNLWEGVAARTIAAAVEPLAEARFVIVHGYDRGWSTNLPIEHFLGADCLFADRHDGEPLSLDHGGPLRLVVPRLYAWKSAKWVRAVEFAAEDRLGFWERGGYHRIGDPWKEQRFRELP